MVGPETDPYMVLRERKYSSAACETYAKSRSRTAVISRVFGSKRKFAVAKGVSGKQKILIKKSSWLHQKRRRRKKKTSNSGIILTKVSMNQDPFLAVKLLQHWTNTFLKESI